MHKLAVFPALLFALAAFATPPATLPSANAFLAHVEDRTAVARAAAMLEAMGGREGWANLESLYIAATHTEPQLDAPYQSEIWRNVGRPEVRILQQRGDLVSERVIIGEQGWSTRNGETEPMGAEMLAALLNWDRHVFYGTIKALALGGRDIRVSIDAEDRLRVYRSGALLGAMTLSDDNIPVVYHTPSADGGELYRTDYTEWAMSGGLYHPVVSEPANGAVYRSTEWRPSAQAIAIEAPGDE